jgi:hypothetical protein
MFGLKALLAAGAAAGAGAGAGSGAGAVAGVADAPRRSVLRLGGRRLGILQTLLERLQPRFVGFFHLADLGADGGQFLAVGGCRVGGRGRG